MRTSRRIPESPSESGRRRRAVPESAPPGVLRIEPSWLQNQQMQAGVRIQLPFQGEIKYGEKHLERWKDAPADEMTTEDPAVAPADRDVGVDLRFAVLPACDVA